MESPAPQQTHSLAWRVLHCWRREWLLWALVWCVARGLLLVSFADVFGYGEELEKACAAKAMLDALPVPHYQLAYHYYEGGGFVVSHLDALAFALLGESLLAVKLVALGLGTAVLWAGWRLSERIGGRNAARAFALLFVFAPASVQKLSLLTLGIHFHALFFVALVLDASLRLIVDKDRGPRPWFQLGLAAGLGFYFSYQLALTNLVALSALGISLRSEVFRKPAWFGVLGLATGISPLCWMAAHVGGAVFDIHGAAVVAGGSAAKLDELQAFFVSVFSGRGALDWAALIVLCIGPLLGFFALRSTAAPRLRIGASIVLAHIALFLVAYVSTSFTVGRVYHYFLLNRLTPLWWLAMLFTTIGAVAAWNSRRRWERALAGVVIAGLSLFGALDTCSLTRDALATQTHDKPFRLFKANLKLLARIKGYVYPEYLAKISSHVGGSSADKLRLFLHFHESCLNVPPRPLTVLQEGIAIALYGNDERKIEEIQRELADAGIADPRGFFLGLGSLPQAQLRGDFAARVRAVESYPPELRDTLIEAVGSFGRNARSTEDWVMEKIRQGIEAKLPTAYFVGVGRQMYNARGVINSNAYFEMRDGPWMLNRERAFNFIRSQPEAIASALMDGYEAAHHDRWIAPSPWWMR